MYYCSSSFFGFSPSLIIYLQMQNISAVSTKKKKHKAKHLSKKNTIDSDIDFLLDKEILKLKNFNHSMIKFQKRLIIHFNIQT